MTETKEHSGKAIIFSAPSGAGKTTIVHHLLQQDLNLAFSISATSRPPRPVERDGKDYYYLSREEFEKRIAENQFLEWEEVYGGQYYGTLNSEIDRIWGESKHVIFDVDVVGGLNLKRMFRSKALSIFVQAPSLDSLRARLESRDTETPEKIAYRMDKAEREMGFAREFDVVLVNDNLQEALVKAEHLVREFLAS